MKLNWPNFSFLRVEKGDSLQVISYSSTSPKSTSASLPQHPPLGINNWTREWTSIVLNEALTEKEGVSHLYNCGGKMGLQNGRRRPCPALLHRRLDAPSSFTALLKWLLGFMAMKLGGQKVIPYTLAKMHDTGHEPRRFGACRSYISIDFVIFMNSLLKDISFLESLPHERNIRAF